MPVEPGDPVVAVQCIGILCKTLCFSLPVEMYDKFFDRHGNIRPKWQGANVCAKCTIWFSQQISAPVMAVLKGDDDDNA